VILSLFKRGQAWKLAALALMTSTAVWAGTVTVTPTVTPIGGGYQYAYSITNTTPDDSFSIDIPVYAGIGEITNVMVPTGFTSDVDTGTGDVFFLEDTSFFGSTPTGGFSFDSPVAPGPVTFTATLLSAADGSLYTISGPTVSPAPAPEPGYLGLFAFLAPTMLLLRRFRQGRSSTLQPAKRT
jgi:hypothetical protein